MRILSESHLETRSKTLANALVGVVRRVLPRPTPTTCAQKRLWVSSKESAIIYLTKRSSSLVHQPRLLWKLRGTPCWILILPTSSCVSRFRVSPDCLLPFQKSCTVGRLQRISEHLRAGSCLSRIRRISRPQHGTVSRSIQKIYGRTNLSAQLRRSRPGVQLDRKTSTTTNSSAVIVRRFRAMSTFTSIQLQATGTSDPWPRLLQQIGTVRSLTTVPYSRRQPSSRYLCSLQAHSHTSWCSR